MSFQWILLSSLLSPSHSPSYKDASLLTISCAALLLLPGMDCSADHSYYLHCLHQTICIYKVHNSFSKIIHVLCYGQFSRPVGTEVDDKISAITQAAKLDQHMNQETVAIRRAQVNLNFPIQVSPSGGGGVPISSPVFFHLLNIVRCRM